jgi:asparagine synthase (glutamine-hydrolysing)
VNAAGEAVGTPPPHRHHRSAPRSWIAVVADAAGLAPWREQPARQIVVAAPEQGRGLALFAAEAAELPQWARRGEVGVVFEGTLLERRQLADALGLDDADARSNAELVLAAYERWGEGCAGRLRGPHAAVLWDGAAQRLIATCDRLGLTPLMYADTGRELVLATSADLVRRHPRVPRELNRARLAELFCLHIFDVRETAHAAIRRVAPGHRWVRGEREERHEANWEPRGIGALPGTLDDHLARFDELLDRAVERAVAPGDLAILLSGGLDSVSVAATAAERCRALGVALPRALSLVFPDEEANEEQRQRSVAAQLGLPLTMLDFYEASGGEANALGAAVEASRSFPSPAMTLWRPAYLRLLTAGRQAGCRVVLTGHGGDEWLDVSIYLAADYLQRFELGKLLRFYGVRRRSFRLGLLRALRNVFWRYGARPVLAASAVRALGGASDVFVRRRQRSYFRRSLPVWVGPDPALRRELAERADRFLPRPVLRDFYVHENASTFTHPMSGAEYEEIFEVGRQSGLIYASPYLDEELVEFLVGVPPEVLSVGDRTKGLVRASLAKRFPRLGFEGQKKVAATSFFRRLVHDQAPGVLSGLGSLTALEEMGVVDRAGWRSYTEALFSSSPSLEMARIWFALSTEAWARAHG